MKNDETAKNDTAAAKPKMPIGMFSLLALVMAGAYLFANRQVDTGIAWETDFDTALATAAERNTAVLVEFTTAGCVYCVKMDREVLSRRDVHEQMDRFVSAKIHWSGNEYLINRYGIDSFPTFLVIRPDGQPVLGVSGYQSVGQFKQFLDRAARQVNSSTRAASPNTG